MLPCYSITVQVNYCSATRAHFLHFVKLPEIQFAHTACVLIVMYPKSKHCRIKGKEWDEETHRGVEKDRKRNVQTKKVQKIKPNCWQCNFPEVSDQSSFPRWTVIDKHFTGWSINYMQWINRVWTAVESIIIWRIDTSTANPSILHFNLLFIW